MIRKRYIRILLAALGCLVFVACQKEELPEEAQLYKTIISVRSSGAKAHYRSGSVIWDVRDRICVARGNTFATNPFVYISTDEHGVSTFGGDLSDVASGSYYAIYPAQSDLTISEGSISCVAIPSRQTLCENSFGKGDNTAVGYGSDCDNMMFYNVGGLAKIALIGDAMVKNVKITNNALFNNKLSGRAIVDVIESHTISSWDNSAVSYVSADVPAELGSISVAGGKIFYLVLPPCVLKDFSIEVTDVDNRVTTFRPDPVTITRSNVSFLGKFEVNTYPANNQI